MKSKDNLIGAWGFLIGVILAILVGLFQPRFGESTNTIIYSVLVVSGIIVGFLNVEDKDWLNFLFAALSLVIVSGLGQQTINNIVKLSPILAYLSSILSALLFMFIPATIIVALKSVFALAHS
jgi:hypothetical protein